MNLFLKYPGSRSLMTTMITAVTAAVLFRFLMDGIEVTLLGTTWVFKSVDATTYAALLAPVYAAFGWNHQTNTKNQVSEEKDK